MFWPQWVMVGIVALVALAPAHAATAGREPGEGRGNAAGCTSRSMQKLRNEAEQGHATAQRRWADALAEGRCGETGLLEASRWYEKSAAGGDSEARFRIGMMYLQGEGVSPNPPRGAALLLQAAEAGHRRAQYAVGSLYASGRGVPRDKVQAYKWIRLSIDRGDEHASSVLRTLGRSMTEAEISEAEEQARLMEKPARPVK